MKKSFSTTLLCGVIASSFILVNCQKSPGSRGVAPTKTPSNAEKTGVADVKNNAACSTVVMDQRKKNFELTDSIRAIVLKQDKSPRNNLSSDEKAKVIDLNKQLNGQCNDLVTKLKTEKITNCISDADKEKKEANKGTLSIDNINKYCDMVDKEVQIAIGEKTERSKEQEAEQVKNDIVGKKFYIANDELADFVTDKGSVRGGYIANGELVQSSSDSDLLVALNKKDQTVCQIEVTQGSLTANDELTITTAAKDDKKGRQTINGKTAQMISLGLKDSSGQITYGVLCYVPNGKNLLTEFKTAFGKNLTETAPTAPKEDAVEKTAAQKADDKAAPEKTETEKAKTPAAPAAATTPATPATTASPAAAKLATPVSTGTKADEKLNEAGAALKEQSAAEKTAEEDKAIQDKLDGKTETKTEAKADTNAEKTEAKADAKTEAGSEKKDAGTPAADADKKADDTKKEGSAPVVAAAKPAAKAAVAAKATVSLPLKDYQEKYAKALEATALVKVLTEEAKPIITEAYAAADVANKDKSEANRAKAAEASKKAWDISKKLTAAGEQAEKASSDLKSAIAKYNEFELQQKKAKSMIPASTSALDYKD